MNNTIALIMLNGKIEDYIKYNKNDDNYEKHLGELILKRQNIIKKIDDYKSKWKP